MDEGGPRALSPPQAAAFAYLLLSPGQEWMASLGRLSA